VQIERHLPQGAQDVGSAVVFHAVFVFAPQHVAPPVSSVLNVPVLAHSCGEAVQRDFFGSQAADKVTDGRRGIGAIEMEGLGFEDAACVRESGRLRLNGQEANLALLKAAVLFLYVACPKRGRCAPGWLAAKAL
jgi:hypothetical protein